MFHQISPRRLYDYIYIITYIIIGFSSYLNQNIGGSVGVCGGGGAFLINYYKKCTKLA